MPIWKDFEETCTKYLNDKFGDYAEFSHLGCSDSTKPDILVKLANDKNFYIDVKHSPAQCGQFVLIPNIERHVFEYSTKNVSPINIYSTKIIDFMNLNFETYRNAGTAGKDIKFPNSNEIFSNWIIKIYKEKGVRFFITNNCIIFPIDQVEKYFYISAKYRIKRSGSCSVRRRRIEEIKDFILSNDYSISSTKFIQNKLFVTSDKNIDKEKFILGKYEYMFAKNNNVYEVRQLSNTYNANVIFSIELKDSVSGMTDTDFIQYLKS